MPRNSQDALNRLRHAALELFAENGFEQTTAAQIAARAGLTERTFFRHFPDKREVLFDGQEILAAALTEAILRAPPGLSAIDMLRDAFAAVTPLLEGNRQFSEPRRHIIAAAPALLEREVAKHAALARIVAQALQQKGIEKLHAGLAAEAGLAVLGQAIELWFDNENLPLADCIAQTFEALQLFAAPARAP